MKFSCILGNPPYGQKKKGSSPTLHLKIMKTILDLCTDKLCFIMPSKPITQQLDKEGIWYKMFKNAVCIDIKIVKKGTFQNTKMDDTAIYYCDRNALPDDYDKQLDVDDKIYNAISNEGKLFIDKMSKMKQLKSFMICGTASKEKDIDDFIKKSKNDKWYFNVNAAGVKPGDGEQIWISGLLAKENIHTQDEELEFSKVYDKSKRNIIECPTKEYGENLKNLMINGKVLRYGLWLTQTNQNIYTAQFRYVPDVDYTTIDTDEKLLKVCGFSDDEIKVVMKYLNDFDFTRNRNELVRGIKEEPDSSSSGSEPSKPV